MIEGQREARVPDHDASTGRPLQPERLAAREAEDVRFDVTDDLVRPHPKALRHEFRLARVLGDEDRNVVTGAEDTVGALVPHGDLLTARDRRGRLDEPERERRKGDRRRDVRETQPRPGTATVLYEQDHREELVQETDIPGKNQNSEHRWRIDGPLVDQLRVGGAARRRNVDLKLNREDHGGSEPLVLSVDLHVRGANRQERVSRLDANREFHPDRLTALDR